MKMIFQYVFYSVLLLLSTKFTYDIKLVFLTIFILFNEFINIYLQTNQELFLNKSIKNF